MLHLSWPLKRPNVNFSSVNYTKLKSLHRATRINRESFEEYIENNTFVGDSDSIPMGLIRSLGIEADWDLDYLVSYVRLRSYSLATPFKLTSISNQGSLITSGLYKENTKERWVLIDNEREYELESLNIDKLSPIIPLYSTVTKRSYLPTDLKDDKSYQPEQLAIVGIDLVELAIGWWLYLNTYKEHSFGIDKYLTKHVFNRAQLYQNQLAVINILFECLINGGDLNDLINQDERLPFSLVNENRHLEDVLKYTIKALRHKRLVSFNHLLYLIPSIYSENFDNQIRGDKSSELAQSSWIWEPPILKLFAIYLKVSTQGGYKASDINTLIDRVRRVMPRNLNRINDKYFRTHIQELAELVFELNDENYK